jgi:hypothetical protein
MSAFLRRCTAAAMLAACSPLLAQAQFAWQMPLDTGGERAGAYRIDLPPQAYRQVLFADLRDLQARNAAGEPIPFGPAPRRYAAPLPPPVETRVLAQFELPRTPAAASPEQLHLQIERDAAGVLRRIDLDGAPASTPGGDILLDASGGDAQLLSLSLTLRVDAAGSFRAVVEVLASDDLEHWRALGAAQTVLVLQEGGRTLERRTLDLGGTRASYLLLRRVDADGALPVGEVLLRSRRQAERVVDWPQSLAVDAELAGAGVAGEYFYRAPGPIPVASVDVVPADANSVAEVTLHSRDADSQAWRVRASDTVFRIDVAAGEASGNPMEVGVARERLWRVTSTPPLARAPRLRLSYTPDSYVLLAQGPAPYALVAGSLQAVPAAYPLERVLDQLSSQFGPAFRIPLARVGAVSALAGPDLLPIPPAPLPWRKIVLWSVLVLGAAAVLTLVLRLLREGAPRT